jgi:hypothetical protein
VITLATPVLGAQVADIADVLKSSLGIHDDLLKSLENDDLYLRMLVEFRGEESTKGKRYACRDVDLHAAYEEKYIGPLLIVKPQSATLSISNMVSSPVVGFPLNHLQIVKPNGPNDDVYRWVLDRVGSEYSRLATWDAGHASSLAARKLCELTDLIPEKP